MLCADLEQQVLQQTFEKWKPLSKYLIKGEGKESGKVLVRQSFFFYYLKLRETERVMKGVWLQGGRRQSLTELSR